MPPQLLATLADASPAQFAAALQSDAELPTLYWNDKFRRLLIHSVQRDLAPFCAAKLLARAAGSPSSLGFFAPPLPPPPPANEAAAARAAPSASLVRSRRPPPVRYADIERELAVGGILLRFFIRHGGAATVAHPTALDAQLVHALLAPRIISHHLPPHLTYSPIISH